MTPPTTPAKKIKMAPPDTPTKKPRATPKGRGKKAVKEGTPPPSHDDMFMAISDNFESLPETVKQELVWE